MRSIASTMVYIIMPDLDSNALDFPITSQIFRLDFTTILLKGIGLYFTTFLSQNLDAMRGC
jgi:hypothetical protein